VLEKNLWLSGQLGGHEGFRSTETVKREYEKIERDYICPVMCFLFLFVSMTFSCCYFFLSLWSLIVILGCKLKHLQYFTTQYFITKTSILYTTTTHNPVQPASKYIETALLCSLALLIPVKK